jgi:hypothetical protein
LLEPAKDQDGAEEELGEEGTHREFEGHGEQTADPGVSPRRCRQERAFFEARIRGFLVG